MERKIGEIFEYNGEWYQCLESDRCNYCDLEGLVDCHNIACASGERSDSKDVIFKKLEKVGEPYMYYFPSGKIMCFQRYKLFNKLYSHNTGYVMCDFNEEDIVNIEVKQNKEDMEEYKMYDAKEDIPEFDKVVDECLFGKDKLNLKPFDIQKAREGKPVYTRDGRKARIICFDRNCQNAEGENYPIVALIANDNGTEEAVMYDDKGVSMYSLNHENDYDLMMLPEKKEGWVNVYPDDRMGEKRYSTKEEASCYSRSNVIDTVKIEWEE